MLERYLTSWRVRWYSASILFAIFLGFMICVFYGTGSSTISGRLGGDYPAFYGARHKAGIATAKQSILIAFCLWHTASLAKNGSSDINNVEEHLIKLAFFCGIGR